MRYWGVAAAALLVLTAICSGEQVCTLNCELIQCGIPRCSAGYKLALRPCSCCPSCVADTDVVQDSDALVRLRRQFARKSGSAQLQSRLHSHKATGFLVPEKYKHLLRAVSGFRQQPLK